MSFKKYIYITFAVALATFVFIYMVTPLQKKKVKHYQVLKAFEAQANWIRASSFEERIYTELDAVLIVEQGQRYWSVDKKTGNTLWGRSFNDKDQDYKVVVQQPNKLLLYYDNKCVRIDPLSGKDVWTQEVYTYKNQNIWFNDSLVLISKFYEDSRDAQMLEHLMLLDWKTGRKVTKYFFRIKEQIEFDKLVLGISTEFRTLVDNNKFVGETALSNEMGIKKDTIDWWLRKDTSAAKIKLRGDRRLEKAAIQFVQKNKKVDYEVTINCLPKDLAQAIQLRGDYLVINDLIEKTKGKYERKNGTFHLFDMSRLELALKYPIYINTKFASSASNLIALESTAKFDQLRIIDWSTGVQYQYVYKLEILKHIIDLGLAIDQKQVYFNLKFNNEKREVETKLYAFPLDKNGALQLN